MAQLSNPSQVLIRNLELFDDRRVLVAGYLDDDFLLELANSGADAVAGFSLDFHNHQHVCSRVDDSRVDLQFAANFDNGDQAPWDQLILFLPKAKQRTLYLLANLLPHLAPEAEVYVVGENKGGIKSCGKLLAAYCDNPVKIDSARHCSLMRAILTEPAPAFDKDQWLEQYQLEVAGQSLTVISLPGVFSHGELDQGSELLLNNLGHIKMKRTLDFGCGSGVIGSYLGKMRPGLPLELLDVDALAVESSRLTLAANGVEAKVYASDGFSEVHGKFATIVSNPPFHTGIKTNYDVPERFITTAPRHLMDGGQLRIVANGFLKYQPLLEQAYARHELVEQDKKFKIWSART